MRSILLCLSIVFVLFATQPTAHATIMVLASLEELVRESDLVAVGVPHNQESYWEGTRIFTRYTFDIHEIWAGRVTPKSTSIEIITYGGVVGDIGQLVSGAATLTPGKPMVLCLKRGKKQGFRVLEMAQGAFHIESNTAADPKIMRSVFKHDVVKPRQAKTMLFPKTLKALKKAVLEISHVRP